MSDARSLSAALLSALEPARRGSLVPGPELERALEACVDRARSRYPGFSIPPEDFIRFLARHFPEGDEPLVALDGLRIADLYLACACLAACPAATRELERMVHPVIHTALGRMRIRGALAEDVEQRVMQKLLVAAKIARYAGRGDLTKWVWVVAIREAHNTLREKRPEVLVEDGNELAELAVASGNPELSFLKATYREHFRETFQRVLGELTSMERNLLRHHLLDGLTFEQIGALYKLHRATAARRFEKIRRKLLSGTRQDLMKKLGVGRAEFDSIMRLIQSHIDASIRRFL